MSRTHTHCLVQIIKIYFNENEDHHTVKAARLGAAIAEKYCSVEKGLKYIPALYINNSDCVGAYKKALIENLFNAIEVPDGCSQTDFAFDYRVLPIEQSGAVRVDGYNGWMGYCNIKNA